MWGRRKKNGEHAEFKTGRPWGQYALCFILLATGIAALLITAAMNWEFGHSLALAEYRRVLQGSGALVIDSMAASLALVVGFLFGARRWFLASLIALPLGLYAAASIGGVVGFGSSERIAKARLADSKQQQAMNIAKEANARALEQREDHIKWLRQKYDKAKTQKEKDTLRDKLGEASFGTLEIHKPEFQSVMSDPQAIVISELSGMPVDRVQFLLTVALGVLLISAKMLCFALSAALWPQWQRATAVPASSVSTKSGNMGGASSGSVETEPPASNVTPFPRPVSGLPTASHAAPPASAETEAPPALETRETPAGSLPATGKQAFVQHGNKPPALMETCFQPANDVVSDDVPQPTFQQLRKQTIHAKPVSRVPVKMSRKDALDDLEVLVSGLSDDEFPTVRELALRWVRSPKWAWTIVKEWEAEETRNSGREPDAKPLPAIVSFPKKGNGKTSTRGLKALIEHHSTH